MTPKERKADLQARLTAVGVPWDDDMTVRDLQLRGAVADAGHAPERMARADFAALTIATLRELLAIRGFREPPERADGKRGPPKHADYVREAFQKLNPAAHAAEATAEAAAAREMPPDVLRRIGRAIGARADALRFALAVGDRERIAEIRTETSPVSVVWARARAPPATGHAFGHEPFANGEQIHAAIADPTLRTLCLKSRDGRIRLTWERKRDPTTIYTLSECDACGTCRVYHVPPGREATSGGSRDVRDEGCVLVVERLAVPSQGARRETRIQWQNLGLLPSDARTFEAMCEDFWIGLNWIYQCVPGLLKPRGRHERIVFGAQRFGVLLTYEVPTQAQSDVARAWTRDVAQRYRRRWRR